MAVSVRLHCYDMYTEAYKVNSSLEWSSLFRTFCVTLHVKSDLSFHKHLHHLETLFTATWFEWKFSQEKCSDLWLNLDVNVFMLSIPQLTWRLTLRRWRAAWCTWRICVPSASSSASSTFRPFSWRPTRRKRGIFTSEFHCSQRVSIYTFVGMKQSTQHHFV